MEGAKYWKTGLISALCSATLFVFGTTAAHAELLHSTASSEEAFQTIGVGVGTQQQATVRFVPYGSVQVTKVSHAREDWRAVWQGVRNEWEALRREAATTAVTMFFIRGGTPPKTPPSNTGTNTTPPGQSNTPPGGNGNLPPPGGQGETPPGDPGDPPTGTPEPASFVMALLGAGFVAGCGWRRRSPRHIRA